MSQAKCYCVPVPLREFVKPSPLDDNGRIALCHNKVNTRKTEMSICNNQSTRVPGQAVHWSPQGGGQSPACTA